MRVPLLHREAAGLCLEGGRIGWVGLQGRRRRLRQVQYAQEEAPFGEVLPALVRLASQVRPARAAVVTHLDPAHVRHLLLRGPQFEDPETFDLWLAAEVAHRLPPGASAEDFVVRVHGLEGAEEEARCLVALARREAVVQRLALLERAGLRPVGIGSLELEVGWCLAAGAPEGGTAVLHLYPGAASLMAFRDGRLESVSLVAVSDEEDLPELVRAQFAAAPGQEAPGAAPDRLFVVGPGAPRLVARLQAARVIRGAVAEGVLGPLAAAGVVPVPPPLTGPAALALRHLAEEPAVNFMEPGEVVRRLQERERAEGLRLVLVSALAVAVLLLGGALASALVQELQRRTEARLGGVADRVAEVEAARAALARLEREIGQAEALVAERTDTAGLLAWIGRAAPETLWLEEVRIEAQAGLAVEVILAGLAFDEGSVAHYLQRLEEGPSVSDVRLIYAEAVPAGTLFDREVVGQRSLAKFEIRLQVAAGAETTPGAGTAAGVAEEGV